MAELTVDLTYGTALYQAAAEINKEKQILEEGRAVAGILKAEPEFEAVLRSPAISAEEKKTVLWQADAGACKFPVHTYRQGQIYSF